MKKRGRTRINPTLTETLRALKAYKSQRERNAEVIRKVHEMRDKPDTNLIDPTFDLLRSRGKGKKHE